MRCSAGTICVVCAVLAGLPAQAADGKQKAQAGKFAVRFDESFIATSNILDDPTGLSDTGMRLRGTLGRSVETDLGTITLETGFQTTDYEKYGFANGRAFHANLRQQSNGDGPLSIDTHLGYALARSGDDLMVAGTTLALRQTTRTFSTGGTLKLAFPHDMTAALAVDESYNDVGKADFVANLSDAKVNPDVNRAAISLGLARDKAPLHYGMTLKMVDVALFQQTPLQNAVPYRSYALRAHLVFDDVGGWTLTGSLGLRHLEDGLGLYDRAKPVYKLIAERRLADRYKLKGSVVTDFDAADTDDPLATYRHQLELKASALLGKRTVLDLGGFGSVGDNLLLGNREKRWGAYGELTLKANPKLTFLVRVQYTHTHRTIIDVDDSTLQATLGVRSAL